MKRDHIIHQLHRMVDDLAALIGPDGPTTIWPTISVVCQHHSDPAKSVSLHVGVMPPPPEDDDDGA